MKPFNLLLSTARWARRFSQRPGRKSAPPSLRRDIRWVLLVAVASFSLLAFLPPSAPIGTGDEAADKIGESPAPAEPARDSKILEVLNLSAMIRFLTAGQLCDYKAQHYAELISNASSYFEVNPLEIIALIMVESRFNERGINRETGDYGLGQINWRHWGKEYGLTPQELLDPTTNIFMTCQIYKYFGKDFGKYHRGNGIKSKAYLMHVRSILSTLHAFAETRLPSAEG